MMVVLQATPRILLFNSRERLFWANSVRRRGGVGEMGLEEANDRGYGVSGVRGLDTNCASKKKSSLREFTSL